MAKNQAVDSHLLLGGYFSHEEGVKNMSENKQFDASESGVAVQAPPEAQRQQNSKQKKQPRYHVVLWDDNDHSYGYVILMMRTLFAHSFTMGLKIAESVDSGGRAICLTTTKEHAELKRDQIKSFGRDFSIPRCKGSMTATIEPVDSE